jgi:Fe-Mn family superoxide dismutase
MNVTRRRILRMTGALGASAIAASIARAAAPPKETGLSFEGLLKGTPGFHPRKVAALPYTSIEGFLSAGQLERNYAVYRESFAQLIAAERALEALPRDAPHAAEYAKVRRAQVTNANDVLMHEFYFGNLTASLSAPSRYVLGNMSEHIGSIASWREDFAACARIPEAWAALIYDPYDDRWHNEALGDADAGGWIGGNPLIVCDVAAHAWSLDYRDRETYVARFLDHINWDAVAARYHADDRQ